jgi:hypothetical protein
LADFIKKKSSVDLFRVKETVVPEKLKAVSLSTFIENNCTFSYLNETEITLIEPSISEYQYVQALLTIFCAVLKELNLFKIKRLLIFENSYKFYVEAMAL